MGFLADLFSTLFGTESGQSDASNSEGASSHAYDRTHSRALVAGAIYSGKIRAVRKKLAEIDSPGFRAIVFAGGISDQFVEDVSQVLTVGDAVEFVLIEPNPRNLGQWIVSLVAVPEARVRLAMSTMCLGHEFESEIKYIAKQSAEMEYQGAPVIVPLRELSWASLRSPHEAVRLHTWHKAKITRLVQPDGWLTDKRKSMRAHIVASIRASTPRPQSQLVEMPFSAQTFRLWAQARVPKGCDAVVLHVLEELEEGRTLSEIGKVTGLPPATLDAVLGALASMGLAGGSKPTGRGRKIAQALRMARDANANPVRGLFVSAAPVQEQYQRAPQGPARDYPAEWPRPASSRPAEELFTRASDHGLPSQLLVCAQADGKAGMIAGLQSQPELTLSLRRESGSPWRTVWLQVPEHWVFAGMWLAFDAVGKTYFRPHGDVECCRQVVLVRLAAQTPETHAQVPRTLYFEPWTRTCWQLRDPDNVRLVRRQGTGFPEIPMAADLGLTGTLTANAWVSAGIRV